MNSAQPTSTHLVGISGKRVAIVTIQTIVAVEAASVPDAFQAFSGSSDGVVVNIDESIYKAWAKFILHLFVNHCIEKQLLSIVIVLDHNIRL